MNRRWPSGVFSQSYDQDAAVLRTPWRRFWLGVLTVLLVALPFLVGPYIVHVAIFVGIAIIITQGLNILMGFCGQVNMAQAGFAALGAYTSALAFTRLGLPLPLCLLAGGLLAGLVGVVFAFPALRLRGWYIVFSSLAAQQIIVYIIRRWKSLTGGDVGLPLPRPTLAGISLGGETAYYYLVLAVTAGCVLLTLNLLRTKVGRALAAIRDNDQAAQGMGINLAGYKVLAFFLCCFWAGVGGGLLGHWERHLMPEAWTLWSSVWYMGYLVIGGLGSLLGPVYGVILVYAVVEVMNHLVTTLAGAYPQAAGLIAATREGVFGLMVVSFLIFEPRGVNHRVERILYLFRYWPFKHADSAVVKRF